MLYHLIIWIYKGTPFTNKVNQPILTFLKTKKKILVHATKSY